MFYNTPARSKFLKKDSAEAGLISNFTERLALTHPEISFKLINNNRTVIHTSGNNKTLTTILNLFGKEFANSMIPVDYKDEEVSITGYIGKPEISRANRSYQCNFINKRFIKNKIISSALDDAYKNLITVNRFPVSVLYIDLDTSFVDINVHPSKMEVRFNNEEFIYNKIYEAISSTLKNKMLIPDVSFDKSNDFEAHDVTENVHYAPKENLSFTNKETVNEKNENYEFENYTHKKDNLKYTENVNNKQFLSLQDSQQQQVEIKNNYKIVGQAFTTYIIIEMNDKLYLIDQHAAHERLKYNELIEKYNNKQVPSQSLIEASIVELTFNEFKIAQESIELLESLGFETEPFGDNTFIIRSVPYVLGHNYSKDFFLEVIDNLLNKKVNNVFDLREEMLYDMACKSAVKANKILSDAEMKRLIEDILNMHDNFTCPHGRPVMVSISKYEVEKMFKRIQ